LICLGLGLLLAVAVAPTPIVGKVRFDNVIDFESARTLTALLEEAEDDPDVAAVVLEINSPGGYATSSESLFYNLLALRRNKPLVAVVDGVAASGGYYMAVAAIRIYAPASSYVGNVGTRGGRPVDPLIFPEELSSGPFKLTGGSRFDQIRQLDLVAQSFISNVVALRASAALNPLTIDADAVAEARIYLGSEAQAIGYIDAQGSTADAINGAAELAGLRNFRTVDLAERYGLAQDLPSLVEPLDQQVQRLVYNAVPDTIYMMDDRVALPNDHEQSALLEQLRRLRATAPGPLHVPAAAPSMRNGASSTLLQEGATP
jgi:ClpP class serine protease